MKLKRLMCLDVVVLLVSSSSSYTMRLIIYLCSLSLSLLYITFICLLFQKPSLREQLKRAQQQLIQKVNMSVFDDVTAHHVSFIYTSGRTAEVK